MEAATGEPAAKPTTPLRTVVIASSAGTAFEWYDFFVYGSLTSIFSRKFFNAAEIGEANATLATLAVFAAGLFFRPLGALIFGRLGDRFGRKGAFLATVIMMGGATFLIGLLPDSKELMGVSALLLVVLRIVQGMAVGGEYGGAAIYVAEHCEPHHRGSSTGWIQSSAAFGLMGALAVVLGSRTALGEEAFVAWGWRVPFLASAVLVAISVWMRLRLNESPEFTKMKAEGNVSRAPYAEVFLKWDNLKLVLVAIFSFLMAQGAIWWCVFSYTQIFLERFMKLPGVWANLFLMGATLLSIPLYVFFGWLSDRVGRKPVLILGMVLSVVAMGLLLPITPLAPMLGFTTAQREASWPPRRIRARGCPHSRQPTPGLRARIRTPAARPPTAAPTHTRSSAPRSTAKRPSRWPRPSSKSPSRIRRGADRRGC